jgi:signal recognition particle GTPase
VSGQSIDQAAAALITRDLIASGAGEALARRLIADAAAHGTPLARHQSLRNAVRAQLAHRIIQPPTLPSAGAAIAFVGSGGTGKTSCVASLASAYARASTLPVSAIALAPDDGGRKLTDLLRADQVRVTALQSWQAQQNVSTSHSQRR